MYYQNYEIDPTTQETLKLNVVLDNFNPNSIKIGEDLFKLTCVINHFGNDDSA